MTATKPLAVILADYVEQPGSLETPCWITSYVPKDTGYVEIRYKNKRTPGHRFFFEQLIGPIPKGLQLDHLCRNRACVNPQHTEPVTQRINIIRGISLMAARSKQTRCHKGHELSGENLYIHPTRGNRQCRLCRKEAKQRYDKTKNH